MTHTKAIGTEPFDKSYGLGYQVGHGEFSPYPRGNRLRKTFLDAPFNIDIQRARLVTESYMKTEGRPQILRCMHALQHILANVDIEIYPDELIVGTIAAPAKAAPIYPEFSVEWIIDELENHPFDQRPHDQFYIKDEDKDELIRILQYWRGKTVSAKVNREISMDQAKGSELGKKVFLTSLYHDAGIGHYVLDYGHLLEVGFDGLLEEVQEGILSLSMDDPDYAEHVNFYIAAMYEIQATQHFISRYGKLADEMADRESDPVRGLELRQIAANLRQIEKGPAETMWQALQLWYFATTVVEIESNGHSISYGRMDQ